MKLANGEWLVIDRLVPQLHCYCQGQSFAIDMVVLEMQPYDAILGCDWLQAHSPMECDWRNRTLKFSEKGKTVTLQGLQDPPLQISSISATKVYNSTKGNDIWAFVLVDHISDPSPIKQHDTSQTPEAIQHILTAYKDVFNDPQTLPPQRAHDHAIPLIPGSIPINSKPYHYSPLHKTEIENHVQQLLQAGLIAHSHSPFASPVLLVKKKDGSW